METPEILPAPVDTMDELLAKLDMIHETAKLWDDDEQGAELDSVMNTRVGELSEDIMRVHGSPDDWEIFSAKCEEIRAVVSDKLSKALNATFELS